MLALFIPRYLRRYRELHPFDGARLAARELPVTAARLSEGVAPEEALLRARVRQLLARGAVEAS